VDGIELIRMLNAKKVGQEYMALCPFHNDTKPSLFINLEKNVFHCFGCGVSGTLKKLARMLKVELDVPIERRRKVVIKDEESSLEKPKWLKGGPPKWAIERNPEIAKYEVYHKKDVLYVMIRDINGILRGYHARTKDKKFWFSKGYKNRYFWLEDKVKSSEYVVIVEGVFDAIWLWQFSIPACAVLGTPCKEQAISVEKFLGKTIILMFDGDSAGYRMARAFAWQIYYNTAIVPRIAKIVGDPDENDYESLMKAINQAKSIKGFSYG